MAKDNNLTDFLADIANTIREKKGITTPINPQDFSSEIQTLGYGGADDFYTWNWDGISESGTITADEFDEIARAKVVFMGEGMNTIAIYKIQASENDIILATTTPDLESGVVNVIVTLNKLNGTYTVLTQNIDGGNVAAVDTNDMVDDVNISYATTVYVDNLVGEINSTIGDINSVLESIING